MSIGEQFKGLDMKNLIGGPLTAAADASILLARSTASFINDVGFDADMKTRTALFKFTKQEPTADGNIVAQELAIDVPLLAIVPIPNLQIDEVNILFDMEVKQCEKSESSTAASGSLSAKVGWGPISVFVRGSVSAHSSNTRSSDNSAKYHVDVRATNHGTPEGLARVLDMMAATVSPNILGSRLTDQAGTELTGERRTRSLKLRELNEKGLLLGRAENAARDSKDIKMKALTQELQTQQNRAKSKFMEDMDKIQDKEKKLSNTPMDSYWDELQNSISRKVALAASSNEKSIEKIFPAVKDYENYTSAKDADGEFKAVVEAYIEWEARQKAVDDNKNEYNTVMMSSSPATVPVTTK